MGLQHFDEVKSEKLKEKEITVIQVEVGDALVIGLNGIDVFNANLGGKWKMGGGRGGLCV